MRPLATGTTTEQSLNAIIKICIQLSSTVLFGLFYIYIHHSSNVLAFSISTVSIPTRCVPDFNFGKHTICRESHHGIEGSGNSIHRSRSVKECAPSSNHQARLIMDIMRGCGVSSLALSESDRNEKDHAQNEKSQCIHFFAGTKRGSVYEIAVTVNTTGSVEEATKEEKCLAVETELSSYTDTDTTTTPLSSTAFSTTFGKRRKIPSPIHSMALLAPNLLACGGGDRYLTLWGKGNIGNEFDSHTGNGSNSPKHELHLNYKKNSWNILSKLGPHTGWVRDIVQAQIVHENPEVQEKYSILISIGCERVLTWQQINTDQKSIWTQTNEIRIDSSPDDACTLSADLLCLSYTRIHNENFLFAGGVDGRIHTWKLILDKHNHKPSNNLTVMQKDGFPCLRSRPNQSRNIHLIPCQSLSAHDGRVNCMLFGTQSKFLFSLGNDGMIQCIDFSNTIQKAPVESHSIDFNNYNLTRLILNDNNQRCQEGNDADPTKQIRFTASCLLQEKKGNAIIAAGTSCGSIYIIKATNGNQRHASNYKSKSYEKGLHMKELPGISKLAHKESPMIHDLIIKNNILIVGHSRGVSLWNMTSTLI